MNTSKAQPDMAKVRLSSEKAKKACLEMEQAFDELEQAILQLEPEAQAHKPVKKY